MKHKKHLYTVYSSRGVLAALSLFIVLALSSCYSNRSIMLKTPEDYPFATYNDSLNNKDTYKIAVADFISMSVYTNDGRQRLGIILDANMQSSNAAAITQGGSSLLYIVEPDSSINLPLIGRLKVAGITVRQLEVMLEDKFAAYYNKPFVELKVTNRRFMVFIGGNTAKVINMLNERTTLIEGLALAGGIPQLSKAHNIKLIRGGLSNPTVYQIDMSTLEGARMGGSMILQANDIIYVEPVTRNFDQVLQQTLGYLSAAVSVFTLVFIIFK